MASPKNKERLTFLFSIDVVEKLRDAAFWSPGETMAGIVDRAIRTELANMEKKRGGPFPERSANVKVGRPVKS